MYIVFLNEELQVNQMLIINMIFRNHTRLEAHKYLKASQIFIF